jgi:hypothetical protein
MEAHRVVTHPRLPTFSRQSANRWWGCQALRTNRPLPPGKFLVLIPVRGWVDPMAIVRLEGSGQLKNPMILGIKPTNFRFVAQCNQLCYCGPYLFKYDITRSCTMVLISCLFHSNKVFGEKWGQSMALETNALLSWCHSIAHDLANLQQYMYNWWGTALSYGDRQRVY